MTYEGIDSTRRMITWCWLGLHMKHNRIDIKLRFI